MPRTKKKTNSRNNIRKNNKSPNQWFQPELFTPDKQPTVKLVNGPIYGYVLPHASTAYTSDIIKHTLRFQSATNPPRGIRHVIIFYYPAFDKENVRDPQTGNLFYHEYYVPMQSILATFPGQNLKFYGYNVRDQTGTIPPPSTARAGVDTWFIISADYSHYLPFQEATELENQAAMALCYKQWVWPEMQQSVDNVATFQHVFDTSGYLPKSATLRWVGRTRSSGNRGVGYLSFIITDQAKPTYQSGLKLNNSGEMVAGMFVTAYDAGFHARECLGHWFDAENYSWQTELELVTDVLTKARTTSRLTGGARLDIPVRYYTVTYLFQSRDSRFIRGWHGVMANGAFYLPDVFLENTYESGQWIAATNQEWKKNKLSATVMFDMRPTMVSLSRKAGSMRNTGRYTLYDGYVKHVSLYLTFHWN
jgi:hypothetical protein